MGFEHQRIADTLGFFLALSCNATRKCALSDLHECCFPSSPACWADDPGVPVLGEFIDPEFDQVGIFGGPGAREFVIEPPLVLHRVAEAGWRLGGEDQPTR